MSDPTPEVTATQEPQEGAGQEPKVFDADYVEKLRKESAKYRTEAKANAEAAKRLAEIEEANQSEAEKAAKRLADAEARAAAAEAKAMRFQIATEYGLTGDGAAALEHIGSEDGMRAVAQLLAAKAEQESKSGNHVPREGTATPPPAGDERRAFAAFLTGQPT
jgi:hypothetical protein